MNPDLPQTWRTLLAAGFRMVLHSTWVTWELDGKQFDTKAAYRHCLDTLDVPKCPTCGAPAHRESDGDRYTWIYRPLA